MMPNVRGEASTRRQVVAYAALTALCSLALLRSGTGWIYLAAAVLLGAWLVARAVAMHRRPEPKAYRSFFFLTIQYLGLLLVGLMVDQLVGPRLPL
jgi:protoheme IX farnesyltransferase